ncbi:hypothetical protein [Neobacillus sp. D3-1R]|uniref:hypothetical protein n=1 Tax=Neobacillus sp. D3-1R TaxID=3445778 RepID=UPI003FA095C0
MRGTTPYLNKKPIVIEGPVKYLEWLSILLNVYFDLSNNYEKGLPMCEFMSEDYPTIIELAKEWVETAKLINPHHLKIEDVYEMLIKDLQQVESA